MGITYFYNFCICAYDDLNLGGDILSAVRRSYFDGFDRIRDRITVSSDEQSLSYDYLIEKDKPMRWTVKSADGAVVEETLPAGDGRYYLCFYRDGALYKRLLFSKLHTLLKVEYVDKDGVVAASLEPRKVQGEVRLLYTDNALSEPLILSPAPEITDARAAALVNARFDDISARAATNEDVVAYLSDEQLARFRAVLEEAQDELSREVEESFIGDEAPLLDKINPKDFNVKRNLSSALDISQAQEFGSEPSAEESPAAISAQPEIEAVSATETEPVEEIAESPEPAAVQPDKLIMADGAVYCYYGELDENGNRSGYGRTLTDLGKVAYEGMYLNDKRSGKGAYFYKDGTLCYSGDWSENVRHGVGVGVSARDGSMHIGRWSNNKPEGNGVRLSREGDIKFVCKELEGGGTVLMNYLPDDTVLISKYDKDGRKIAEKTVSLIDF